jgi:hypothetical protein
MSLNNLAVDLGELGRREEGLGRERGSRRHPPQAHR